MAILNGTGGNDILNDTTQADTINALGGNDVINLSIGSDTVYAGAGDDLIRFTGVQFSSSSSPVGLIDGGDGYDVVDATGVSPTTFGLILNSLYQYVTGIIVGSQKFELKSIESVYLGGGDHYISISTNTAGIVNIFSGSGNDNINAVINPLYPLSIYGGAGNDLFFISGLYGSSGSSFIDGGEGFDTLRTNIQFNVDLASGIATGGGATWYIAGFEQVLLHAANGYASSAFGDDSANWLGVNSLFNDGSVGVTLDGRGGDDIISGSAGADSLFGGTGDDVITGGDGNDRLDGGFGFDSLDGGAGDDILIGNEPTSGFGAGSSINNPQYIRDQYIGDGGFDTIRMGVGARIVGDPADRLFLAAADISSIEMIDFASSAGGARVVTIGHSQVGGAGFASNLSLLGGAGDDMLVVTTIVGGDYTMPTFIKHGWNVSSKPEEGDRIMLSAAGYDSFTLRANDSHTGLEIIKGGLGNDILIGGNGNDVLDGRDGKDLLNGGAGDDWIVYDASDDPANVIGGAGYDTLVVNGSVVPTNFDLAAQGFEQAEQHLTDTSGNNWFTITRAYNANWSLTNYSMVNDDGSRTSIQYDAAMNDSWSQIWHSFDNFGRLTSRDIINDDASHIFINIDAINASLIAQEWLSYDVNSRLSSDDILFDNGTRTFVNLDEDDSKPWAQDWFAYDAQGRISSEDVIYDSGARTFINLDEDSSKLWSQDWFTYDAQGRLDSEDIFYDNGNRTFINIDQDNSQTWSQAWFAYDPQGRLDTQDVINDDGSRIFYNYDQAGTEIFTSHAYLYGANGQAYQQIFNWDDGTMTYLNI